MSSGMMRGRGAGAALTLALQNNNDIGDEGARALGNLLKINKSLLYLVLVRLFHIFCFIFGYESGRGGIVAGAHALMLLLQDDNHIGDVGAFEIGQSLKVNSSLLFLKLVRLFIIVLSFL